MSKVFITGIAGFLGSHIADEFINNGDEVAGNDNLIGGYEDNVPKEAIFYYEKSIRDTLFFIKDESPYLLLSERQRFLESKATEYFLPFAFSNKNSDFKEIALLSKLNYKGLLQDLEKNQAKLELSNTDNQNLKNKINFLTKQISSLRDNPEITKNLITEKRAYEKILNSQMPKLNNSIIEVIDVSNSLPENGVLVEFQKYDIINQVLFL